MVRRLVHITVGVLQSCAVKVRVVLPINGFSLHLIIDANIAPDRLLIILELHLDLVRSQEFSSFAHTPVIDLVLALAQEVMDQHRLLFLEMEILNRLVVLSEVSLVRLRVLLHRRCRRCLLLLLLHLTCGGLLSL